MLEVGQILFATEHATNTTCLCSKTDDASPRRQSWAAGAELMGIRRLKTPGFLTQVEETRGRQRHGRLGLAIYTFIHYFAWRASVQGRLVLAGIFSDKARCKAVKLFSPLADDWSSSRCPTAAAACAGSCGAATPSTTCSRLRPSSRDVGSDDFRRATRPRRCLRCRPTLHKTSADIHVFHRKSEHMK